MHTATDDRRGGKLTPLPELDDLMRGFAQELETVLGNNFVGLYLQGSLAIGDFDLTSDIDVVVVIRRDLPEAEAAKIEAVHRRTYAKDNRWVKRLEYSFFPADLVRKPSSPYDRGGRIDDPARKLWYFDNGSRTIERSDHDNTLVVRWTLRERGVPVLGPSPSSLLDPIPPEALREEIRNTSIGWGKELLADPEPYRNRFYQAYLVLNYCRMLHDLTTGRVESKLSGARWAKKHLDERWRALIDHCWEERRDATISVSQPADPEVFHGSLNFVRYAIEMADSLAP